jgi:membrane protease YdiL (CAAX protease family)
LLLRWLSAAFDNGRDKKFNFKITIVVAFLFHRAAHTRKWINKLKTIFFNPCDHRLRSGWRILCFVILLILLSITAQFSTRAVLGSLRKDSDLVIYLIAGAATIAVFLARRYLDKKSFVSLGLRFNSLAIKDLFFGFVLSGLMAGMVFGLMAALGLVDITGVNWSLGSALGADQSRDIGVIAIGTLALLLIPNVMIGWWEELVFRGYLLQNMIEGMGQVWAVLASCILYGLVHSMNPNASLLSSGIIVLFGFLRIYGFLATHQLWLSMGMHIGWNYFQGTIFGYAASGHATNSLIEQTPSGPVWLSGGEFGPEASVLVIPVVVLALLVMRLWVRSTRATESYDAPA